VEGVEVGKAPQAPVCRSRMRGGIVLELDHIEDKNRARL